MPEPFSTAVGFCCCLGYAALDVYARGDSTVSAEAHSTRKTAATVVASGERSHALFGNTSYVISELMRLVEECAANDWDGNSALPLSPMAVQIAEEFIRAIPNNLALPEFTPEPDGSISMEWIRGRHRMFLLSIGETRRLAYARLDGTDKEHGVAFFDGCNIPPRVLDGIQSITVDANAIVRAA